MNKGEKSNVNSVVEKKKIELVEENAVISDLRDKILQELSRLQVKSLITANKIFLFYRKNISFYWI